MLLTSGEKTTKRLILVAQLVEQSSDDSKFEGLNTAAADTRKENGKKFVLLEDSSSSAVGRTIR
jgi:hypothetical protein